jgi:putative phosphoribosyl transferase
LVGQEANTFVDRTDAGRRLALQLSDFQSSNVVVYAIPSGGIPVAVEVAATLKSPLDIIIVRKIPIPFEPEAGYGAVTEDGSLVLNEPLVKRLRLTEPEIEGHADKVRHEIIRRSMLYRKKLPPTAAKSKSAIVIDDGLASGYTMLAAVKSLRHRKVAEITVAVPVASGSAYNLVLPQVDHLICLIVARTGLFAVVSFYQHWHDLNDQEVMNLLENWHQRSLALTR